MVGAVANSEVAVRRLGAAATPTAAGSAEAPLGSAPAGDAADWTMAGTRPAAEFASLGVTAGADVGEMGMAGDGVPGREGTGATGGTPGLPGKGPPIHMRVLAGEAGLLTAGLPATDAAVTIALPHDWQRMTGRVASGLVAGSGALQ
jgi:hypothetical protein